MSEADEICDWLDDVILELIAEYEAKNEISPYDIGAVNALKRLLEIINK